MGIPVPMCENCWKLHLGKCRTVHEGVLVEDEPPAQLGGIGELLESVLRSFGARLTPSPLPLADAVFGAPGWFVPVTIASVAGAVVGGLYATGKLGHKVRRRRLARKKGKR